MLSALKRVFGLTSNGIEEQGSDSTALSRREKAAAAAWQKGKAWASFAVDFSKDLVHTVDDWTSTKLKTNAPKSDKKAQSGRSFLLEGAMIRSMNRREARAESRLGQDRSKTFKVKDLTRKDIGNFFMRELVERVDVFACGTIQVLAELILLPVTVPYRTLRYVYEGVYDKTGVEAAKKAGWRFLKGATLSILKPAEDALKGFVLTTLAPRSFYHGDSRLGTTTWRGKRLLGLMSLINSYSAHKNVIVKTKKEQDERERKAKLVASKKL